MAKEKIRKKAASKASKNKFFEGLMEGLKEAAAHARGEIELPVRYYNVTPRVDVKAIRTKRKLSQSEFADRYGFNVRTLQDWEAGGAQPLSPIRAYLIVIDQNPAAVEKALRGAA
jgi:putative transcriptional regulator